MQNQETIARMQPGERIIEQTDTLRGTIAQTIQGLDGTDYEREMPATVQIDLRSLQALLDLAELFCDGAPEDVQHEIDEAMKQARESLLLPPWLDAGPLESLMAESFE